MPAVAAVARVPVASAGFASGADTADGDSALPRGKVVQRFLGNDPGLAYYVYVPAGAPQGGPILVSVHGISRNAREQAKKFAPYAERAGVMVVAPLFERERFPEYQRLGRNAKGESPVTVLERAVAEVARATGADDTRLYLFGYSGGGQFVHRYAMAWPGRVAGYVVGAAGWYTFPDPARRYPYGLRFSSRLGIGGFDARQFLAVPGRVLVGERDVHPGTALRTTGRVMSEQGKSRIERGERWAKAMNDAARAAGFEPPIGFETLPRVAHSFGRSMRRGDMGARVFGYLFGLAGETGQYDTP